MGAIELKVIQVLSKPFERCGKWWVKVKGESLGSELEHALVFDSKEQAEEVVPGYVFGR